LGADIRKMRRHSYLLLHHISQSISGNFVELDQALRNIRLANDLMMAIYKKKSNLTEEQILKLLNDNIELSASKAFEYGLIDEII
jgi:ATP-dependent protease ClpP protease subunit